MNQSVVVSLYEALISGEARSEDAERSFLLIGIEGAERGVRTRLLELGLIEGTTIRARRRGAHVSIRARGDELLLRRAEADLLKVVTTSGDGQPMPSRGAE